MCVSVRVLAVGYPVATGWVVLATANHYLAEVLAGVLTAALAFAMTSPTARSLPAWLPAALFRSRQRVHVSQRGSAAEPPAGPPPSR